MFRTNASLAAGLMALSLSAPAMAQDLKGGSYKCSLGDQALGIIDVEGARYRLGGGGWHGYRKVGAAILWDGPLGPISAAGEVVGTTLTGAQGFDIQIKARDGGKFQLVHCRA